MQLSCFVGKQTGNYRRIREKANVLKADFGLSNEDLKASNTWVYRFCRRHQIGPRSITHHDQVYRHITYHFIQQNEIQSTGYWQNAIIMYM